MNKSESLDVSSINPPVTPPPTSPVHRTGPISSLDCKATPDAPGCKSPPTLPPQDQDLLTCTPDNGQWSIPHADPFGRSKLNSPCCQAPKYDLAKNYKTCSDKLDLTNGIEQCISVCCQNAAAEANNYDPSWYPMARCACSMWCYNQDVNHFKKYGTAVHYITGDMAEAQTSDSGDFIGGAGYDFSGA